MFICAVANYKIDLCIFKQNKNPVVLMNNSVNDSQIQYRTPAERHIPKRKARDKNAPAERRIHNPKHAPKPERASGARYLLQRGN